MSDHIHNNARVSIEQGANGDTTWIWIHWEDEHDEKRCKYVCIHGSAIVKDLRYQG